MPQKPYPLTPEQKSWLRVFARLEARNAVPRATREAVNFVRYEMFHPTEPIFPRDLLRPVFLQRSIARRASIDNWFAVSRALIPMGYISWLAILRKGANPSIVIDAEICNSAVQESNPDKKEKARAESKLLAIVAHEVGHELMRDRKKPRRFVRKYGQMSFADPEDFLSEAEAWLFAGYLRAFVFAAIASFEQPDKAPDYV